MRFRTNSLPSGISEQVLSPSVSISCVIQKSAKHELRTGMVIAETIKLTEAIVISQSCDTQRAENIVLAPLSNFQLVPPQAAKRWKIISASATSLNDIKSVYIPGNSILHFQRRLAEFGEAFTLPREFLEDLTLKGKRVAGLSDPAIAYLQFRLGLMFTRMAQDDYIWPSVDDLQIKTSYLEEELKKAEAKRQNDEADTSLPKDHKEAELLEHEDRINSLKSMIADSKKAIKNADELVE